MRRFHVTLILYEQREKKAHIKLEFSQGRERDRSWRTKKLGCRRDDDDVDGSERDKLKKREKDLTEATRASFQQTRRHFPPRSPPLSSALFSVPLRLSSKINNATV